MIQTLQKNKKTRMEAKHDFWSVSGSFIYQRHVMNQEKYAPREDAFPVPLKYIDVVRHTQTNLDIPQEHTIDSFYNVDSDRPLSGYSERPLSGSWF